jgi:hypothetical protein
METRNKECRDSYHERKIFRVNISRKVWKTILYIILREGFTRNNIKSESQIHLQNYISKCAKIVKYANSVLSYLGIILVQENVDKIFWQDNNLIQPHK